MKLLVFLTVVVVAHYLLDCLRQLLAEARTQDYRRRVEAIRLLKLQDRRLLARQLHLLPRLVLWAFKRTGPVVRPLN